MKKIILPAFAALMLTACSDNTEDENSNAETQAAEEEQEENLFTGENDSEIEIDEVDEEAVESAEKESDNHQLGEAAEIDGITLTINDAYMTDERSDESIIDVSGVLVLDVTYDNGTDETFPAGRDITVESDGEHIRSYDLDSSLPADIAPGESITGKMAYGLVNEPGKMTAVFEPLMNSEGEQAVFDITVE